LLNPCGYPEEEISHSKEKQGEEKHAICVPKVQERKEETIFTREQEEINVIGEIKKEKDKTIEGRKEQQKVEKGELIKRRKMTYFPF
jgi:hypothetical protein